MKAAIRTGLMGKTISFTTNHKEPKFNPKNSKKLKVKINAAAINPVDYKMPRMVLGKVIGFDFCGTVQEIGSQVTKFAVGDQVYGVTMGSLAEYAISEEDVVAKKPSHLTCAECGALGVAYQSSLQCLRVGNLIDSNGSETSGKDKSLLVIGASGGCGVAGLQLAKGLGVTRIVGICSGKNSDLVKEEGATEVIDYTNETQMTEFLEGNKGQFDCVLDCATGSGGGEDYWNSSISLLKKDTGHYTTLNGSPSKWIGSMTGRLNERETLLLMKPNGEDLELIATLLGRIDAKPIITQSGFTENEVLEGLKKLKGRRVTGKLVFDINSED